MPGDGGFDDGSSSAFPGVFITIFVIVVIVIIVVAIMNARKVVKAGRNPLTLQTDLELQALNSQALAPAHPEAAAVVQAPSATVEEKLARLDDLHARKVISDEELAASRLKVLSE